MCLSVCLCVCLSVSDWLHSNSLSLGTATAMLHLVGVTKIFASTISSPLCQEQLIIDAKQVAGAVELVQLRYKSTVGYCRDGMHLSIHQTIVLGGCISQYIRLLYWRVHGCKQS